MKSPQSVISERNGAEFPKPGCPFCRACRQFLPDIMKNCPKYCFSGVSETLNVLDTPEWDEAFEYLTAN
ncbi:hypothetical protein QUF72_21515 [Desulfobacterales bacterium HSG2]|nr:hypothetical protein [Desulfobacterales bacterium HSG2]